MSESAAEPVRWHVSPDGDDASDAGPFASLAGARDAIRRLRARHAWPQAGVCVEIEPGIYPLTEALTLDGEQDSGVAGAPIVYRAASGVRQAAGQAVTFTGGVELSAWRRPDESDRARLAPEAFEHVRVVDLDEAGVRDLGFAAARGGGAVPEEERDRMGDRPELFVDGEPMTLARWPDEGFVTVTGVTGEDPFRVHGIDGDRVGRVRFEAPGLEDRLARWREEADPWAHGYWFWDWSDESQQIAAIDPATGELTLAQPHHHYGYRPGQRFYAFNLLCELTRPGEWHLDRDRRRLYIWPDRPLEQATVVLSVTRTLAAMANVHDVRFEGLTFEACRGDAITLSECRRVEVVGCRVRNTGQAAVTVSGGEACRVAGCDLSALGEGGVYLTGGDRQTLTPAGHVVENCWIHDFARRVRTYRPAVRVGGVGQVIRHNLIHDAPHCAVLLGGNDHVFEFNEIHSVCWETGDVGAYYAGRDWTVLGNVVRGNFFHHIEGPGLHGAQAVYLDDAVGGFLIEGNVFYRAGRAAFIGGGRWNRVINNLFVDNAASVHVDNRGMNWMHGHVGPGGIMRKRLEAMPYREEPWRSRYPELLTLLDDEPEAPKYNVVQRNVSWRGKWLNANEQSAAFVTFENNLIDVDPKLADEAGLEFTLQPDSPAWAIGFEAIPFHDIGLRDAPARASWPVPRRIRAVEAQAAASAALRDGAPG